MGKPNLKIVEDMPGIEPVEYRVLVKPEPVKEKTDTGIYLPDDVKERQQMAAIRATVVKLGGKACHDEVGDELRPWPLVPQVGDRVLMKKYAGEIAKGADGVEYRLIQDKEILGVWRG